MIKITDDWAIEKDRHCLILKQKRIIEEGKHKGEERWDVEGYYRDMPAALKGMVDNELLSKEESTSFLNNYLISLEYIRNMVEKHVSEHFREEISEK